MMLDKQALPRLAQCTLSMQAKQKTLAHVASFQRRGPSMDTPEVLMTEILKISVYKKHPLVMIADVHKPSYGT